MKVVLISIFLLSINALHAQTHEIGLFGGASNYHGDLASEIVLGETHPSGGVFYRYNFDQFWAYRPMLSFMTISGSDENYDEYRLRNLSFKSNIIELSNTIELNFQPFSNSPYHNSSTFYAFAGVAIMYHNPKAELRGEWHKLRSLNTENLPTKDRYNLFQFAVPFGGGYKHSITRNFIVGLELGWRKTFTDYLDDVSTVYPDVSANYQFTDRSWEVSESGNFIAEPGDMRGDPNLKDWYFQGGISLTYKFTPILCWSK